MLTAEGTPKAAEELLEEGAMKVKTGQLDAREWALMRQKIEAHPRTWMEYFQEGTVKWLESGVPKSEPTSLLDKMKKPPKRAGGWFSGYTGKTY